MTINELNLKMRQIGQRIRAEDNRMTSHPIFMVRQASRGQMINVQPCFTEAGAGQYIWIDGHNLLKPEIYVASGYRNQEWIDVREFLKQLPPP